jgi:hypothetical protein
LPAVIYNHHIKELVFGGLKIKPHITLFIKCIPDRHSSEIRSGAAANLVRRITLSVHTDQPHPLISMVSPLHQLNTTEV